MSSSNQTLVAEDEPNKAVESEPVPVPTEQNLGGNTEEGVVGVEEEGKGGSFGAQLGEGEETEKTQFGEDGNENSGGKLDDDDGDEKSEGKELEGGVIPGDRAGDGEAIGVQGEEEETGSAGKDGVVGEGSKEAAAAAAEENKVEEEAKEEEEEVAVSEVKEDGQNEGAVKEINEPEVVVSPPVESVPEEGIGTADSDTFVANGVEDSEVLDANLTREVEAENENVPTGLNESAEPSTENEGKNDDVVVKGDELEEPSTENEGKNGDVVVKGDELEEPSTENEGKNDDVVVKGDESEEPSTNVEGKDDVVMKGDESEEPSTENEGKNDDVVVKGVEVEEAREAEDGDNYEAVLTGDELEEDEIEDPDLQPARVAILEKTEAEEIMREIEEANAGIDGQLGSDSDEEMEEGIEFEDDDEEDREDEADRESFDSALAALLKAATGGDGNFVISPQDDSTGSGTGSRIFKIDRPAGLGPSAPALRPRPTGTTPARPSSQLAAIPSETGTMEELSEEEKALHEKIESIRVKFLRLVHRSGHSPEDTVARQVLHRLSLAEGFRRGRMAGAGIGIGTSIEAAWKKALQLEAVTGAGTDDLKFSVNILVLGKAGVGKSATINSIFNSEVASTDPFAPASTSVREFTRMVDGIKFHVIDTPGLKTSIMDQNANRKILARVKSITKRCPPDIVLYVDRIDTQTRDLNDLPLLRTITSVLGSSIWFNAIVALTHAGLAPPEGPNGSPLTYESFVAQRSHVVQLAVRQGAGDMRLMNPVALVENHQSCRRNRDGHKILPNGQSWRQQLLLLCYSSKILSEANELLKLQDNSSSSAASKLFGFRFRSPPLPFLLSSLLQTRAHPKLANDQGGDINGDSDVELDDFSDYEEDDEDEYDQLPPFKPLRKSQIAKLSKDQRKAYFEEYEYRVKLLQKKQWREEVRRMKEMKRRKEMDTGPTAGFEPGDDYDQDNAPASVQVPLPDMVLPPSFDADAPTYRYRFLEPTSGFLARPVLDTHGWDHDCGYDGVSLEETLALASKFPANVSAQITKDKKEFSIHLESAISSKHGENGSSLAGFDIQTIGRQLGYIIRGETKFKNLKRNKTTGGITVTFLGDIVATGAKLEDQLSLGKRLTLVASTGGVRAQGDIAYGANLEARLRDKDYPIGQALTTLGLSLMKWRGDLALGANLQSQIPVGTGSKVALRVGLNNKLSGQISVRTSTSDHFQIAFLALVPVVSSIIRTLRSSGGGESFAY